MKNPSLTLQEFTLSSSVIISRMSLIEEEKATRPDPAHRFYSTPKIYNVTPEMLEQEMI